MFHATWPFRDRLSSCEKFAFRNSMTCLLPRREVRGAEEVTMKGRGGRAERAGRPALRKQWRTRNVCTHAHNACHGKGRESPGRVCGYESERRGRRVRGVKFEIQRVEYARGARTHRPSLRGAVFYRPYFTTVPV